jgi:hypothetical protein
VPVAAGSAVTLTWSGHGKEHRWSDGANWEGGQAPSEKDGVVDLRFPLSACQPRPALCPSTLDDVPGVIAGRLTLEARVIRVIPKPPPEPPPFEASPLSYSVFGSETLRLAGGIDALTTEEGSGTGLVSSGGTTVGVPVVLVADNSWSIGPAPGASLNMWRPVGGRHALTVTIGEADQLELGGTTEVGPVRITGAANSHVVFGGFPGPGDLNGTDGEPIKVEGASLAGSGRIGPLTLHSAWLTVGSLGTAGLLEVNGGMSLEDGSSAAFVVPGPIGGSPSRLVVSGHAEIGGTTLHLWEICPSPGASFTLVEAREGISGLFRGADGAPIYSGMTLAGPDNGCGPGSPAPAMRIDYSATAITATALALPIQPTPPAPQPSAGIAPPSAAGGVEAFSALARSTLVRDLATAKYARHIRRLLRQGGEAIDVEGPRAGTLVFTWTTRPRHGASVLLASGALHLPAAGRHRVFIRLTRRGRALLARASRLRVTVTEEFTTPGLAPVALTGTLTLRR